MTTTNRLKQSLFGALTLLSEAFSLDVKDWWKGRAFAKTLPSLRPVSRQNSRGWKATDYYDDENLLPMDLVLGASSMTSGTNDVSYPEVTLH